MAYLSLEALGIVISRTRSNRDIIVQPAMTDPSTHPSIVKTQRLPSVLRAPSISAPHLSA